jgi:1-acyl-sn-glycerol-3-phosphate acyltransferase
MIVEQARVPSFYRWMYQATGHIKIDRDNRKGINQNCLRLLKKLNTRRGVRFLGGTFD